MPDLSGMELARVLDGKKNAENTRIIFATAYHQFAIEGYKVEALDYLLKPYSYEEFLNAATKAYQYFERISSAPSSIQSNCIQSLKHQSLREYIFLKVEYNLVKVMLKDIAFVEAYKDYVKVHLLSKPHPLLSLTSLKNMEEMLPKNQIYAGPQIVYHRVEPHRFHFQKRHPDRQPQYRCGRKLQGCFPGFFG